MQQASARRQRAGDERFERQLGLVGLEAGEAVAVLEQRDQLAVGPAQDADAADVAQPRRRRRVGAPDRLVAGGAGSRPARRTRRPGGVRTPRTAAAPTAARIGFDVAGRGRAAPAPRPPRRAARGPCGTAWRDPCRAGGRWRTPRARTAGSAGTSPASPAWIVSPSCRPVALTRPTTSPGNASSTVSRSAPNAVVAYLVVSSRPVRSHVTVMPRSKRPEQMRAKARRSRCDGSMFAWTLNTNAENGLSSGRASPSTSTLRRRWRGEVDDGVEDHAHPEVRERRADEHRRRVAGEERRRGRRRRRRRRAGRSRRPPSCQAAPSSAAATSVGTISSGASDAPRSVRVKRMYVAGAAVDHAAQVAGDADRPRGRRRAQPDLRLDLVEQLERLAAGAVVLVEEREHRQPAAAADLEQLERLGLDALGRVEHHHHGVDAGEHAVGVLGEVLVAGGVEQVDDVVAVRELQHRRADRDAALALELHPVRRRRPPPLARLHRAGPLHGAGVEQELLGQRRLAGVGVAR